MISALAALGAPRLVIRTDLVALLPDSPVAADYRLFLDRFGGFETLYVLVGLPGGSADDAERLGEAACDLAERIEGSPLVTSARCGWTEADERFLFEGVLPRALLLIDPDKLPTALARIGPDEVRRRVGTFRARLAGPLGELEARRLSADPLGLAEDLAVLAGGGESIPVDPALEVFLSDDQRTALVIATPSVPELDAELGRELQSMLDATYSEVREQYGADLTFEAIGGPLYAAHDQSIIRADLMRTIAGSLLGITLLLLLYFRSPWIPLGLVCAVGAGVLWTAGALAVARGGLSVIGISFASILIGLGVDYGIHGGHAFRSAWIGGAPVAAALFEAFRRTRRAILASAVTTVAAFLVLNLARFGPVRELGQVVALGVAATLLASVLVGASLVALLTRGAATERDARSSRLWNAIGRGVERTVRFSAGHRSVVLGAAVGLTLLLGWGANRVSFDADFRSFRPRDHPAESAERALLEQFALGMDRFHVVVEGEDLDGALARASRVAAALREQLGDSAAVTSPSDFLAGARAWSERRDILAAGLPADTPDVLREALGREGFTLEAFEEPLVVLDELAAGRRPPPVPPRQWPDWLRRLVRFDGGSVSIAVSVSEGANRWPGGPPPAVVQTIRREVPDARIASAPLAGVELRGLVGSELRRLAGWCLLVVGLVVVVSFRGNVVRAVMALVPVALGCLWLLGLCGLAGIRINLFSAIVAPLLLGIGIDDGLHVMHGVKVHGSLARSATRVGSAMTLTTLTTCVGFGSLALSRLPALRSGGLLIAVGTLLCLVTSLVLLPAMQRDREPRR